MSYKLEKPYNLIERADFVTKYNHEMGLSIEETETALFALEDNEIIENGMPVINPNYEKEQAEKQKQIRLEELKLQLEELDKNESEQCVNLQ